MSIRPKARLGRKSTSTEFMPSPSLNNPLKITIAKQFDKLLSSPAAKNLFLHSTKSIGRSYTPEITDQKKSALKLSPSFTSQSRESPVPNSFNYNRDVKKPKNPKAENGYLELIDINCKMKSTMEEYKQELNNLDKCMNSRKRKVTFNKVKDSHLRYQDLKNSRMGIIKKQRILNNAYPEGDIFFGGNDFDRRYFGNVDKEKSNIERLFCSDQKKTFKEPDYLRTDEKFNSFGVPKKNKSCSSTPNRIKKFSEFSQANRKYNIVTGAAID